MLFYTVGQSRIFLTMLYSGMLAGVYVTLDSALRRLFGAGKLLGALMDLLLGVASALSVILGLLRASGGELRLYALLGALCGFLIYMATVHPLLEALFRLSARLLRSMLHHISRLTLIKKFFR